MMQINRCYNCDQPNFTREHLGKYPAKGVTCNFRRKIGHFERTCRGKRGNQRGRGVVGMIRGTDDNTNPGNFEGDAASQHASSIGWVNSSKPVVHSSDSSSSDGDYMVMAVRHKKFTELKVAGAQLPIRLNGKASRVWIDSGSPISIFTIGELRRTLGASGLKLDALSEDDTAFRDCGNNPLKVDWNHECHLGVKRLESGCEDKGHRKKPPIYNRKGLDASVRTTTGATNARGSDCLARVLMIFMRLLLIFVLKNLFILIFFMILLYTFVTKVLFIVKIFMIFDF